jgi:hypothetical protein
MGVAGVWRLAARLTDTAFWTYGAPFAGGVLFSDPYTVRPFKDWTV